MTGGIDNINSSTKNILTSIQNANLGATRAGEALLSNCKKSNIIDSIIASSLTTEASLNRIIQNNLGRDKAKIQIVKDTLLDLQDITRDMKKTLLYSEKPSTNKIAILSNTFGNQIDLFNKTLLNANFDKEILFGVKPFNISSRLGVDFDNNLNICLDSILPLRNGEKVRQCLDIAIKTEAIMYPELKEHCESTFGSLTHNSAKKFYKCVIVKESIKANLKSLGLNSYDGLGQAVYSFISKASDNALLKDSNLNQEENTFHRLLSDHTNSEDIKKILNSGPGNLENIRNIFSTIAIILDDTLTTTSDRFEALENINTILSIYTKKSRRFANNSLNKLSGDLANNLTKVNDHIRSMESFSGFIEKKINVTYSISDQLNKPDLIKTSQEFINYIKKLSISCYTLLVLNKFRKATIDDIFK